MNEIPVYLAIPMAFAFMCVGAALLVIAIATWKDTR